MPTFHRVECCVRLLSILPLTFSPNHRNEKELCDPVTRTQFKLGPEEFPRFLWEGEVVDDADPTVGFLRHPILFAVSRPTP